MLVAAFVDMTRRVGLCPGTGKPISTPPATQSPPYLSRHAGYSKGKLLRDPLLLIRGFLQVNLMQFTIPNIISCGTGLIRGRDSVVGIATGYGLDSWGVGVRVPVGSRIFSSPRRPDWFWGPATSYSMSTGGSFLGGKAVGSWSWPLTSS
jgi:hypothetical protein